MTCIVGLVEGNKIWMGGDCAGVQRLDVRERRDAKVFIKGNMIFGFCGSFRVGQLLRFSLKIPEHPLGTMPDPYEYMVTRFVDAVRQCLKDGGVAEKSNDVETGGTFLVGYQGRLFRIENDYQVGEVHDPYDAIGCGDAYALGSLFTTDMEPEDRVKHALITAAHFSGGVRPPFTIKSI
jgi:ATP-dependent protease HslVU (ClpYQ) peptidase subunit